MGIDHELGVEDVAGADPATGDDPDFPALPSPHPASPPALPDDALVVRGGHLNAQDLKRAVDTTHRRTGVWGVSTNAGTGVTVEELARRLPHAVVRVSTVGRLRAAGWEARPTGRAPHCTVYKRGAPPDDEDIERLQAAFEPSRPNPGRARGRAPDRSDRRPPGR